MEQKEMMLKLGTYAFLLGIIIAFALGMYQGYTLENSDMGKDFLRSENGGYVAWVLAVLGIIVGILAFMGKGTITKKETSGFLLAGIALVIMGGVFQGYHAWLTPYIGALLEGVATTLAIFIAPTVGLLAIRSVWDMGKD